jgi:uncharacterized membrane protein
MNSAHLHLAITHVPILSALFGLVLLLFGSLQQNRTLQRASLWTFVFAASAAVPTYLSGRSASALLMKVIPGLSADPNDQHAEVAILALVAIGLLGLLSLWGLVISRAQKPFSGRLNAVVLLVAVVTAGLMAWTAQLGGNIRHPEIHAIGPNGTTR